MDIFDIIDGVILFQFLMVILFILLSGRGKRINGLIALFFFVQANGIVDSFVWKNFTWFAANLPHLVFIPQIILKLWGPVFYLYVRSVTVSGFRLRKRDAVHLLPMTLFAALIISTYFRFPVIIVRQDILLQWTHFGARESMYVLALAQIVNLGYIAGTLLRVRRYVADIKGFYSSLSTVNIGWLRFFVFGFPLTWIVDTAQYLFPSLDESGVSPVYLIHLLVLVLACGVTLFGWRNPDIFVLPSKKGKYEKYPLTDEQKGTLLDTMNRTMAERKPYLDPELTLKELSRISSIPERQLSRLLNEVIGQNFYDYINGFRVSEAMRYLEDTGDTRRNILEILFESGFNSKTSFNVAFKKHTGMSPTEFKRRRAKQLTPVA